MTKQPHSAAQFTASRDFWWNADFLDLMARRLGLASCRKVLDLGAGKGHWTQLIAERVAPDATITAIDRERRWLSALEKRFSGHPRLTTIQADVATVALRHRSFDLVTCQTLLMHVPDVKAVLHRAFDLLAPGGLLLLSEPDNFANRLAMDSVRSELTPDEFGHVAAMWWAFEKGREKSGLGQEWIAVRLPALINAEGFIGLQAFINDRPAMLAPPYSSKEERTAITDWLATPAQGDDVAAREEVMRFVLAGGMEEAAFDRAWTIVSALDAKARAALNARTLTYCTGNLYLFAARRPAH